MRKLLSVMAIALMLLTTSCAALLQGKSVELDPVILSEITYHGEVAGIMGPGEFGDFSVSYTLGDVHPSGLLWLMEFLPTTPSDKLIFMLWLKDECPEAVALMVHSMETNITKYFIYDSSGVPHEATKDAFDVVLAMTPTCSPPKQEI